MPVTRRAMKIIQVNQNQKSPSIRAKTNTKTNEVKSKDPESHGKTRLASTKPTKKDQLAYWTKLIGEIDEKISAVYKENSTLEDKIVELEDKLKSKQSELERIKALGQEVISIKEDILDQLNDQPCS